MSKPDSNSVGVAYSKEAAKQLRAEIQKSLQDGRKAHYMKIPNIVFDRYWVWIDSSNGMQGDKKQ